MISQHNVSEHGMFSNNFRFFITTNSNQFSLDCCNFYEFNIRIFQLNELVLGYINVLPWDRPDTLIIGRKPNLLQITLDHFLTIVKLYCMPIHLVSYKCCVTNNKNVKYHKYFPKTRSVIFFQIPTIIPQKQALFKKMSINY